MKRLRSLRPTPSIVIACAALFIALAGTSVAAVSIVIPRNSVGSLQLRANSVNSAKVRNGSLLRADFRSGQIPAGPQGPRRPRRCRRPRRPDRRLRRCNARLHRRDARSVEHGGRRNHVDHVHEPERRVADRDDADRGDGQASRPLLGREHVLRRDDAPEVPVQGHRRRNGALAGRRRGRVLRQQRPRGSGRPTTSPTTASGRSRPATRPSTRSSASAAT